MIAHRLPRHLLFAVAAFTIGVSGTAAASGLFRAYLSLNGKDTNPCTLTAPCRLLPAALATVSDQGEIWMLDSANYNTAQVSITKSVTILAVPGALGSIVATGGDNGLLVNAAGIMVTVRNLSLVHLGTSSANGIEFSQGAELNVEDCEISGMGGSGIYAHAPSSNIAVKNTVLRGNALHGFRAEGGVIVVIDRSHMLGNGNSGVFAFTGSRVTVSNSVMANNVNGAAADSSSGPAGSVQLHVANSIVTGNELGIVAGAISGSSAGVVSESNVITFGSEGFHIRGNGGEELIYTRGNNTVGWIGLPVGNPGESLTPLGAY